MATQILENPDLDWSSGEPVSRRFQDVYFSRHNGLEESRHVFLQQNRLQARWQSLPSGSDFTIAETGFGTGLNFLCAVELWLRSAPADCRLHYISVEKYPLDPENLARAQTRWPALAQLSQVLLAAYPPLVPGFHRRWLYRERVCLTLLLGDAETCFEAVTGSDHPAFAVLGNPTVDAWFLDGFAPSRNPDLWRESLFRLLARLSHSGTSLATFSAASCVRRGLTSAGFVVEKVPGYGRKRDMLRGRWDPGAAKTVPPAADRQISRNGGRKSGKRSRSVPWDLPSARPATGEKRALIIGGGIAGCTTASALARHGWHLTLVDSQPALASGASGNPQGIVYPKLSPQSSPLADFGLTALCHAQAFYRPLWETGDFGERCGVLVLPENADQNTLFERIAGFYSACPDLVVPVTGDQLARIAGVPLAADAGLYFPNLGWLNPGRVCQRLADHPAIDRLTATIAELEWRDDDGEWCLLDDTGNLVSRSPVVIIACGTDSHRFTQTRHLPLKAIRGQITLLPATRASAGLNTAICGRGYIAPAADGLHSLGATYNFNNRSLDLDPGDHASNLAAVQDSDAGLAHLLRRFSSNPQGLASLAGRAALRCTTPDYLPVAGPAPHFEAFIDTFAELRRDGRAEIALPGSYWPGLYLNCGHGSRGLSYAPLAAEWLASHINGECPPLPRGLAQAIGPARFIIRGLKRKAL